MNPFDHVRDLRPGKSVFDLSYEKKLTCDMGQLIPIMCDEVVPGDVWEIGNQTVLRMQPLITPIMHEVNIYLHYYFVPYRLLYDNWENFITGGVDGQYETPLPTWNPDQKFVGSLWDYLGFPPGVTPTGAAPLIFPAAGYNLIYNEFYRDETLQTAIALSQGHIKYRAWEKDYFTSALPWQQRGTTPALPITGESRADFSTMAATYLNNYFGADISDGGRAVTTEAGISVRIGKFGASSIGSGEALRIKLDQAAPSLTEGNIVDFSDAVTFDVSDLRTAIQVQRWLERNARTGVRYTEFIRGHFGVAPRDDRLQRPEYIGGAKYPVIVSEVLQTSATDTTTPQGTLVGHGLGVGESYIAKYHAQEYGLIMGIMSVMPKPAYHQGINRQWLRRSKFDFYFPEFANLSEQAIEMVEVYAQGTEALNRKIYGYQGRYDEMRVKSSMVCGLMRTDLNTWHLGRSFSSEPALNASMIECIPTKRAFAVPSEPGLIVNVGNKIRAIRPLPVQSNPGLMDH